MKRIALLIGSALVVVIIAVGAYLIWNTQQGSANKADDQQAAQQFFADRGNGTPAPDGDQFNQSVGPGPAGARPPGVFGTVDKVDGNTLTVKNALDNSTTSLHIGDSAKVQKEVDATIADLTPGTPILVLAQKEGDTLTAQMVQIGAGAGGGLGGPGLGGPMLIQGGPAGGSSGSTLAMPEVLTGTVASLKETTLTVQRADGTTAPVTLPASTQLHKQTPITAADIKVGDTVVAQGTQQGNVFEATQVQVGAVVTTFQREPGP